ncbi:MULTISPECIES: hypothetical protein [unclassified Thiocapsa]|uniref:hypothetical protein n=1 Tax=unclassified Thiocapsa TaxID=2641286 RepID=UPI0035AEAA0B
MSSIPDAEILRSHGPLFVAVLVGVSRFAGYVEGAKNADIESRTGDAVRQAVKWELDPIEGSAFVRGDVLGSFIRVLESLPIDPLSARLADIADAAKALHRIMGDRARLAGIGTDEWVNYAIPNELKAAASRLTALLEAWIGEIMGSV